MDIAGDIYLEVMAAENYSLLIYWRNKNCLRPDPKKMSTSRRAAPSPNDNRWWTSPKCAESAAASPPKKSQMIYGGN